MDWHPPLHLGVVVIEKGAFGSPSTLVANFPLLLVSAEVATQNTFFSLVQSIVIED